MTGPTRQYCEESLSARFNEYRNLINTVNEGAVFDAVDAFVDCLRREGATPEATIIAIKELARSASAVVLDKNERQEDLSLIDSRIDSIVTRAIQRYFENASPFKGFGPTPRS